MRDFDILQTDRGMGKTTAVVERAKDLLAEDIPVAVLVATEMQARHLHHLFAYHGIEARPDRGRRLRVLTVRSADRFLLGWSRDARILAEDVDTWPDGIYSDALQGPHTIDLVTSSLNTEPTLDMVDRVTRSQREAEARRRRARKQREQDLLDALMYAYLVAYIGASGDPKRLTEIDGV